MCPSILVRLIGAFRERSPDVQVSIVQRNTFEGTVAVLERAQLGIGYLGDGSKRQDGSARSWVRRDYSVSHRPRLITSVNGFSAKMETTRSPVANPLLFPSRPTDSAAVSSPSASDRRPTGR